MPSPLAYVLNALVEIAVEVVWTARVALYLLRHRTRQHWLAHALVRLWRRATPHDRAWQAHPAVATGDDLTFGERAADRMKAIFSTWTALFGILVFMAVWLKSGGFGSDPFPFILLNLCLSCLAALQCFILLIAAKRADQIAAAIALHTLDNTENLAGLIEQNTALTEQVADLTRQMHARLTPEAEPSQQPSL